MSEHTIEIDGIPIDAISFGKVVEMIASWAIAGSGGYVVTPNVDHLVKARRDRAFRSALLGARLRVPDGMGIVYGSRLAGTPLPGTVTGRLLPAAVVKLLSGRNVAIAAFGGPPGVAERAADALRISGLNVVAVEPPISFEIGTQADSAAVAQLRASGARVVFVGLGAPKQELWMQAHSADLGDAVLVGVGAALDVLAGRFKAAPTWMTRLGLEWAYRLAHEPRRLARRYLMDDPRFFIWMLQARLRG